MWRELNNGAKGESGKVNVFIGPNYLFLWPLESISLRYSLFGKFCYKVLHVYVYVLFVLCYYKYGVLFMYLIIKIFIVWKILL